MSKLLNERTADLDNVYKGYAERAYKIMENEGKIFTYDEMTEKLYSIIPQFKTDEIFQRYFLSAFMIALITYCEDKNIDVPGANNRSKEIEISKNLKEKIADLDDISSGYIDVSYRYMAEENRTFTFEEMYEKICLVAPQIKTIDDFKIKFYSMFMIALITFCEDKNIKVPEQEPPTFLIPHRTFIMGKRVDICERSVATEKKSKKKKSESQKAHPRQFYPPRS